MGELTPLALPNNPEMIKMFQAREAQIQSQLSELRKTYTNYTDSELRHALKLTR